LTTDELVTKRTLARIFFRRERIADLFDLPEDTEDDISGLLCARIHLQMFNFGLDLRISLPRWREEELIWYQKNDKRDVLCVLLPKGQLLIWHDLFLSQLDNTFKEISASDPHMQTSVGVG